MTKQKELVGRVALVTGANRDGIGRAIARRIAAEGARVVVHASGRQPREGLEETRGLIVRAGGEAACIEADLMDDSARSDLVERASACFGPIDILVNNAAGNVAYAPPSKMDLPGRLAMFEINLHSAIDLALQAIPGMRERGWGRIVSISSSATEPADFPYIGPPKFRHTTVIYGAAKLALERYTTGLADVLMGSGVTINCTKPTAISWSKNADQLTRMMYDNRPDLVEPVEMLAEAVYLLVTRGENGLLLDSRTLLQKHEAPLHAVDGETLLGNAAYIIPREQIFASA